MVVDTELYDLLEIKPDATESQIRKGYFKAARKWHPDKNKTNPDAEEMFKKISEANKVLSDPELRAIYDERGLKGAKEANQANNFDPVEQTLELAKALFGFGKFDTIFGEVTTLPLFVMALQMMANTTGSKKNALDASDEVKKEMEKKQVEEAEEKEKELIDELAMFLTIKVKMYTTGNEDIERKAAFRQMIYDEAIYLSSFPGGDELLGAVGYIYAQEAKQHLTRYFGVEKFFSELAETSHSIGQKMSLVSHAFRLISTSSKLQAEVEKEEQLKLEKKNPDAIKQDNSDSTSPNNNNNNNNNNNTTTTSDKTNTTTKPTTSRNTGKNDNNKNKMESGDVKGTNSNINININIDINNNNNNNNNNNINDNNNKNNTIDNENDKDNNNNKSGSSSNSNNTSNATDSEKKKEFKFDETNERQRVLMEQMLTEGLSAMWKLGKYLIEERVRKVCEITMTTEKDNKELRDSQIEAVLEMGQLFQKISKERVEINQKHEVTDEAQQAYGLPKFR